MHIDVSRARFDASAQSFVLVRLPVVRLLVEDRRSVDGGKMGLLKSYQLALRWKTLFRNQGRQVPGMTHGGDPVITGLTDRLTDLKIKNCMQV